MSPMRRKPQTAPRSRSTGESTSSSRTAPPRRRSRIDPRFIGRRAEVDRAAGRRRLVVVAIGFSLLSAITALVLIAHMSLLSVRHVHISGDKMTSEQAILVASGLGTHPPLIDINIGEIAASIKRLPWIDTVSVARSWPDSVTIAVTERNPVAALPETKSSVAIVDATGRVLEFVAHEPKNLVPLVMPAAPLIAGSRLNAKGVALAKVAAAVPISILGKIHALQESSVGVEITLQSGTLVELGQASELAQKMVALDTLLSTPSVVLGPRSSVDLRVPDAPVVTSR